MRTRLSDTCDTLTYQSNLLAHCVQLTQAINAEAAKEVDEGDEGHEDEATRTTRAFVCEQQRLRVPATSDAAAKLKEFHDQIVELSESHARSSLLVL